MEKYLVKEQNHLIHFKVDESLKNQTTVLDYVDFLLSGHYYKNNIKCVITDYIITLYL